MGMLIRLNLIGAPAAYVNESSKSLPMRSLGRLVAYLCLAEGNMTNRHDVAAEVWRGEDFSVTGNRLRVSLNRLRTLLGDCLVADRDSVGLSGVEIQVDLFEVEDQLLATFDEVDRRIEMEALRSFLPQLMSGLAEELDFASLEVRRLRWSALCMRVARRLAELGLQFEFLTVVEEALALAQFHKVLDKDVWEKYLHALQAEGLIDRGLRELRNVTILGGEDVDFDVVADLKKLGDQLRIERGPLVEAEVEARALIFGKTLVRVLEESPAVLAEILMKPEVEKFWIRRSSEMLKVLSEIMESLEPGSDLWVEIGLRKLEELGGIYDAFGQIALSEKMLTYDLKPHHRSRTLYFQGFSNFQVRRWDEALRVTRETQATAEALGDTKSGDSAMIAEASILWHMGHSDEARILYQKYVEKYSNSEVMVHRLNTVICRANLALVEIFFGSMEQAKEYIDLSFQGVTKFEFDPLLPMLLPVLGFIERGHGQTRKAVDHMIDGMRRTFPRGSYREGQCVLDLAAGFLALEGRVSEGQAVFDWVEHWREETSHQRSVAESKFVVDCMAQQTRVRGVRIDPNESYRNVMAFTIRQLRDIQARSSR